MTATPALTAPREASLDGLVNLLSTVEEAAGRVSPMHTRRTKTTKLRRPEDARTAQTAFELIDSVTRKMDAVRRFLEKTTKVEAPQNKVLSTFDALLANGELLESSLFQDKLGWTRQALSKAVLAHRVFFIEVNGVRAYPTFYVDLRYNRKSVEAVTKLLGELSGGSKWLFFNTPKGSLATAGGVPRSPLQALEGGELALVMRTATSYAER